MLPLQQRTAEGYRAILYKFQDTDSSKFDMTAATRAGLVALHVVIEEDDRIPGYVVMFDFTGLSMGHIVKISLTCLKQLLVFVQVRSPSLNSRHL